MKCFVPIRRTANHTSRWSRFSCFLYIGHYRIKICLYFVNWWNVHDNFCIFKWFGRKTLDEYLIFLIHRLLHLYQLHILRFWSWETFYVLTFSNIRLVGQRHNGHNMLVTLCNYVLLLLKTVYVKSINLYSSSIS